MGNCLCCAIVGESSLGVVEELGKFSRILDPGFYCINCCFESVAHRPSLMLQQFTTNVETLTKDRISVTIKVGIQYKINYENIVPKKLYYESNDNNNDNNDDNEKSCDPISTVNKSKSKSNKNINANESTLLLEPISYQSSNIHSSNSESNPVYRATYKTKNPVGQMIQFIEAYFRGIGCDFTMNELFVSKGKLSDKLTDILNKEMFPYGFIISSVRIMDIDPPANVKQAMNMVAESVNKREATINTAEANKVAKILSAEADSEVRRLEGEGIAKQRNAIADGLKGSLIDANGENTELTQKEFMTAMMTYHYIDTLNKIAERGGNTFILSAAADATKSIEEQMRTAILSTQSK